MQFANLIVVTLAVLASTVKGVENVLPEISKSASLMLDAVAIVSNGSHANLTIMCNDKEVKNLTLLECKGKFEINIRQHNHQEHSRLKATCDGRVHINHTQLKDEECKVDCNGKYVMLFEKTVNGKNDTKEEFHHTVKCSEKYKMQRFEKGDTLLNETCKGNYEERDSQKFINGSHTDLKLDGKDINSHHAKCVAKCDGVEVTLDYPYPCSGVYQQVCSSSGKIEKNEVCDGTFRTNHGRSCRGLYKSSATSQHNRIIQRCDDYFSSLQHHKGGSRSQFDQCTGTFSYTTVRSHSSPVE
eukprot:TRINITY_DN526_c0_g1_i2.p1 TRINITY_DN526_c0_g1~~TRINITY_DN526_c0_g1_i2.p1  ORF type:complete len:299 (-),score=38.10 TRINITY_DN526_c0_g1_i2:275-1171(-)